MKKILSAYWPLLFVALIVGFNLVMLFPETTIKMDLNDNVFAYTLIREMNNIVNNFLSHPSWSNFVLIFDHWVPQWAMGYPLPHFYQHIPHLTVVLIYHFFSSIFSFLNFLFDHFTMAIVIPKLSSPSLLIVFNLVKYLMLSFFPLIIYYSARKFEFGKIASAGSALVSTLLATNYLYGTDYNALVFRGSGMYTQLWGIFFLPLALSSIYYSLQYSRGYIKSVVFLSLTLAGHLVFGYMAVLSTPLLVFSLAISNLSLRGDPLSGSTWQSISFIRRLPRSFASLAMTSKRLFLILSSSFLLLSYWLIPLILNSNYQNKSVWDDFTKFNSYGWQQILKWLVNGEIFDYGRLPVLTILVAMGFFYALYCFVKKIQKRVADAELGKFSRSRSRTKSRDFDAAENFYQGSGRQDPPYLLFPMFFLFWLILYFGRFTWGGLFDLLPMSEGLHGHRLINGVHFAGIFLIGLTLEWIYNLVVRRWKLEIGNWKLDNWIIGLLIFFSIIGLLLFPAFKERSDYLSWNNHLIGYFNNEYTKEIPDFDKALTKINELGKARINLGRPGNWGRSFTVGGFSAYFVASEKGFDTIGFLPESWSLHSDIEQFFSENDPAYYNLFNIRYIIAQPEQKFDSFAHKLDQFGKFVLYRVETPGNFSFINSDILIHTKKTQKINLDRFWVGSKLMPQNEFPTVSFDPNYTDPSYKLTLTMTDWSNFKLGKPDKNNGDYNFFSTNPFDLPAEALAKEGQLDKFVKLDQFSSTPSGQILSEKSASNYFSATVTTPKDGILLLRATYHPFWHAFIDGKSVTTFMVEPAMTAIRVPKGKHEVEFKYYAGLYKQILILISLLTIPGLYLFLKRFK